MYIIKTLFVHPILQSSQTVSDSTVCLCKFHEGLTNYLIFNAQAILQRGGVLISLFRRSFPGRDIGDKKEE